VEYALFWPFTPVTRVRIPVGTPDKLKGLSTHDSPFFLLAIQIKSLHTAAQDGGQISMKT